MYYVVNKKDGSLLAAKCRHCSHFTWSIKGNWSGWCDERKCKVINNSIACDCFGFRFPELKPVKSYVQLNLFKDEKSV